jgi:hypothetical protein
VIDRRGDTYDPTRDAARLNASLSMVFGVLTDPVGERITLAELQRRVLVSTGTRYAETGLAARCRELRRKEHGGFDVRSKREGASRWVYWIEPDEKHPTRPRRLAESEHPSSTPEGTAPAHELRPPSAPEKATGTLFDVGQAAPEDEATWPGSREARNAKARRDRRRRIERERRESEGQ